ncbi:hypothetical protein [Paracoccus sp. DMF]|uniref:hypothetical protein n=1 Tax=Paracoccus sp. DMF TaxID=400837 RepID=UPI0021E4F2BB|nr:hypothetical protein [Paracoccus sp. DMF]MCV2449406.1 hypothetical protein [Paracoccus sp. DMF]
MAEIVIGAWLAVLICSLRGNGDYVLCYAIGASVCWIGGLLSARRTGQGEGDE